MKLSISAKICTTAHTHRCMRANTHRSMIVSTSPLFFFRLVRSFASPFLCTIGNTIMSKKIDYFFTKKKTISELPSSSVDFLKQKLIEASNQCENVEIKDNIEILGGFNDNQIEKRDLDASELKKKLDEANKKIIDLNKIVAKQNTDIKLLKHSLNASNRLCVSKDLKIERLFKEKNGLVGKAAKQIVIFKRFEEKIDSSVLKELRSVPTGQSYDSGFILKLIRHLYAKNISVLLTRNATGKTKTAITPYKKNIIQDILRERVITEKEDEVRVQLRTARVGILINDAIRNIVRPLKKVKFYIFLCIVYTCEIV